MNVRTPICVLLLVRLAQPSPFARRSLKRPFARRSLKRTGHSRL